MFKWWWNTIAVDCACAWKIKLFFTSWKWCAAVLETRRSTGLLLLTSYSENESCLAVNLTQWLPYLYSYWPGPSKQTRSFDFKLHAFYRRSTRRIKVNLPTNFWKYQWARTSTDKSEESQTSFSTTLFRVSDSMFWNKIDIHSQATIICRISLKWQPSC